MNLYQGQKRIENYAFSKRNILGKGSYANVLKGRNLETGKLVAVKMIDKKLFRNQTNLKNIISQIQIMKKLKHQNIVQLLNVFQTSNNIYIITQLCQQGDLMHYLKRKKYLSQKQAVSIIKDVISAFKYLISHQITHRDLKPANILFKKGKCKITDFGFAKKLEKYSNKMMNSMVGTPLYMSPQILQFQSYTNKSDIWSIGLIFYEMLYGTTPWNGMNQNQLLKNIKQSKLQFPSFNHVSQHTKRIISYCLQIKQDDRISWKQLFDQFQCKTLKLLNDQNQQNSKRISNKMKSQFNIKNIFCYTPEQKKKQNICFSSSPGPLIKLNIHQHVDQKKKKFSNLMRHL